MILRAFAITAAAALVGGCFPGNEFEEPAPRDMIVAAAGRCGVLGFKPTPRGDGFAAYVDVSVPNSDAKEACIIEDVEERQGYRLER